eukprot:NODE_119_length_18186_cov_1.929397.p15 type:complete len:124 gc:universal NODE_119_length_18186_cov_1.929397:588-217(-)
MLLYTLPFHLNLVPHFWHSTRLLVMRNMSSHSFFLEFQISKIHETGESLFSHQYGDPLTFVSNDLQIHRHSHLFPFSNPKNLLNSPPPNIFLEGLLLSFHSLIDHPDPPHVAWHRVPIFEASH